jgi:hypothetical protein
MSKQEDGKLYFALAEDGSMYNVGNHGDWEAAEQTATDLGLGQIWLTNEDEAVNWANFILEQVKENKKALKALKG